MKVSSEIPSQSKPNTEVSNYYKTIKKQEAYANFLPLNYRHNLGEA